jgi:hypothetical protein
MKLLATIKRTSKYSYQNNMKPGKKTPIPFEVDIGGGNFGAATVYGNSNQYPLDSMVFYVRTERGSLVKLGGL